MTKIKFPSFQKISKLTYRVSLNIKLLNFEPITPRLNLLGFLSLMNCVLRTVHEIIFRTFHDNKNSCVLDVQHSMTWCETLFFDFLFGAFLGQQKSFNAHVFLTINTHSLWILNVNNTWWKYVIIRLYFQTNPRTLAFYYIARRAVCWANAS